jgi:hypothetical protein
MTDAQSQSPIFLSQTFPPPPASEIWRENILSAIDTLFAGGYAGVLLEGPEDIGKTITASQFARSGDRSVLCLFVRNASRLAYDPHVLRLDLCQQINLLLTNEDLPDLDVVDDGYLRNSIFKLQRHIKRTGEPVYVIIDGP